VVNFGCCGNLPVAEYFVPALVGLTAPYRQRDICGAFFGLTRAAKKAQMVRAVLESIAYIAFI